MAPKKLRSWKSQSGIYVIQLLDRELSVIRFCGAQALENPSRLEFSETNKKGLFHLPWPLVGIGFNLVSLHATYWFTPVSSWPSIWIPPTSWATKRLPLYLWFLEFGAIINADEGSLDSMWCLCTEIWLVNKNLRGFTRATTSIYEAVQQKYKKCHIL